MNKIYDDTETLSYMAFEIISRIPSHLEAIVKEFLEENDYDGIFNESEGCACAPDDLFPCGDPQANCEAGWKTACDCGDNHDWHITPWSEGRVK
jgi:hypothetical protein